MHFDSSVAVRPQEVHQNLLALKGIIEQYYYASDVYKSFPPASATPS